MAFIRSELIGALGNQLFNWASGYSLAKKNGWDHLVDESQVGQFGCFLGEFGILTQEFPYSKDLVDSLRRSDSRLVRKCGFELQRFFQKRGLGKVYQENYFHFDPNFLKMRPNMTIRGYFQSWKYFEPHLDDIKNLLKDKQMMQESTNKILDELKSESWLGVHVRRGDYLKMTDQHGLTSKRYYDDAIKTVRSQNNFDRIVVFSENIDSAREVVPSGDVFLSPKEISCPAQNLMLMSKATSFIGSNSTYSWWSAFLMEEDANIVFPRPWFAERKSITDDLLMPKWLTIGI
jgi:hypothetical protein